MRIYQENKKFENLSGRKKVWEFIRKTKKLHKSENFPRKEKIHKSNNFWTNKKTKVHFICSYLERIYIRCYEEKKIHKSKFTKNRKMKKEIQSLEAGEKGKSLGKIKRRRWGGRCESLIAADVTWNKMAFRISCHCLTSRIGLCCFILKICCTIQ